MSLEGESLFLNLRGVPAVGRDTGHVAKAGLEPHALVLGMSG